jgi:hypothetical protein
MGDNGELKKEAVDAALAKAEKFKNHPEQFVDVDELICAAKKNSNGQVEILIGHGSRQQYMSAKAEIDYRLHAMLDYIEAQLAQERIKNQRILSGIKDPKGGIMNFAKRFKA